MLHLVMNAVAGERDIHQELLVIFLAMSWGQSKALLVGQADTVPKSQPYEMTFGVTEVEICSEALHRYIEIYS